MKRHLKNTLTMFVLGLAPVISMASESTIDATAAAKSTPSWIANLGTPSNYYNVVSHPLTEDMFKVDGAASSNEALGEYFASIESQVVFSPLARQQEATSLMAVSGLGYDPNYVPGSGCSELSTNTVYTVNSTVTGSSVCFYFDVPLETVRIEVDVFGQTAGNNHDILVAQDDPANPYSFPIINSSSALSNSNERVSYINDAGHYYVIFNPVVSNGDQFNFVFYAFEEFDEFEINDSFSNTTPLTHGENITANIDTQFDFDVFEYVSVGTELYIHNEIDPSLHQVIFSIDGGQSFYYLPNTNEINVPSPGTSVLLLVQSTSTTSNRTIDYTLGVYDDRGLKIGSLVGLIVNSQSNTGVNYLTQVIPGYYVNGYPIRGGVLGHRVRFFGQIKLQNGEDAAFRKLNFDYYLASDGYYEYTYRTNELGHVEVILPLSTCNGYEEHIDDGYALEPDTHFIFDLGTFHFTAETVNGVKTLNSPNLDTFFDLCLVHNGSEVLNPFTYEPYED